MLIDPVVEKLDDIYRSKSFEPSNVTLPRDGIDIETLRNIISTSSQFDNIFNARSSMVYYPFESFVLEDGRTVYPYLVGLWLLPKDAAPKQNASFMAMLTICSDWKPRRSELMTITYKNGKLEITDSPVTDNPDIHRKIIGPDFQHFTQLVYTFVDHCKKFNLSSVFKVKITEKETDTVNVAGYLRHPTVRGPGLYDMEINV